MMTYNPGQDDEDKNGIGDTCDDLANLGSISVNRIIIMDLYISYGIDIYLLESIFFIAR